MAQVVQNNSGARDSNRTRGLTGGDAEQQYARRPDPVPAEEATAAASISPRAAAVALIQSKGLPVTEQSVQTVLANPAVLSGGDGTDTFAANGRDPGADPLTGERFTQTNPRKQARSPRPDATPPAQPVQPPAEDAPQSFENTVADEPDENTIGPAAIGAGIALTAGMIARLSQIAQMDPTGNDVASRNAAETLAANGYGIDGEILDPQLALPGGNSGPKVTGVNPAPTDNILDAPVRRAIQAIR